MATVNRIDPEQAADQLAAWLETRLPDASGVTVADLDIPASSGMSNETILFKATWQEDGMSQSQEMVARVQPPEGADAIFPVYDLGLQYRVTSALAEHTAIPVPRPLFIETDAAVLGASFLVAERAHGRVPADDPPFAAAGWITELSPAQVPKLSDNALRVMGDIHAVDWRGLGLGFLAERGAEPMDTHAPAIAGQIEVYQAYYETFADRFPSRTVEAALDWLRDQMPTDTGEPALLWGDARIGNMMFGDDLSVTAVLDWEVAMVGPAECDLGWSSFMMRHNTDALGIPVPEGFPPHDAVGDRYAELTGRTLGDLRYYEVFAGARLAICAIRAVQLLIDAGILPPDSTMGVNNAASHLLARLADVAPPEGESATFFGEGVR